jgi:hypothetical protein
VDVSVRNVSPRLCDVNQPPHSTRMALEDTAARALDRPRGGVCAPETGDGLRAKVTGFLRRFRYEKPVNTRLVSVCFHQTLVIFDQMNRVPVSSCSPSLALGSGSLLASAPAVSALFTRRSLMLPSAPSQFCPCVRTAAA